MAQLVARMHGVHEVGSSSLPSPTRKMENRNISPDSTFPYRLFRFAHKKTLQVVSNSWFAILSKDKTPIGLILSIDIPEQWHHARSGSTSLWQTFVREFNSHEGRPTIIRFEEALKELNKAVVKLSQKVEQTISVGAAILENNQIHFSTIGTSRVLLVRSGIFSDISSDAENSGKQFSAVTSGDIDKNDWIFIGNQPFYEFASAEPDELWQSDSIKELSSEILSRTHNPGESLNAVLIQYFPDDPLQTTLYWEQSEKRYPIRLPQLPKISFTNNFKFEPPKIKINANIPKLPKFKIGKPIIADKKKVGIAAGIVLLAIVGSFILLRGNSGNDVQEVSVLQEFSEINPDNTLNYIIELLNSDRFNSVSSEDVQEIIRLAQQRGLNIVETPETQNELPDRIKSISIANNSVFAVDETGQLWEIDANNQLIKIDHQFLISEPSSIVAFGPESLVVSDKIGNIWHYNGDPEGPLSLTLPNAIGANPKLIARYSNNLYIYTPENGAIYRQLNFSGSITASSPQTRVPAAIDPQLLTWSVNGNFVLGASDNTIYQLSRTESQPFGQIDWLDNSASVHSQSIDRVFASTKQLLVDLRTDSSTNTQTVFWTNRHIADLVTDGSNLWLAIDRSIYRLSP